jgi:hypothetical protein
VNPGASEKSTTVHSPSGSAGWRGRLPQRAQAAQRLVIARGLMMAEKLTKKDVSDLALFDVLRKDEATG